MQMILFLLHDAGETKAFLPLMESLANAGLDFRILAEGTAARLVQAHPLAKAHCLSHQEDLPDAFLDSLSVVLTGLASEFQLTWASYFKLIQKPVIGYLDALSVHTLHNRADAFCSELSLLLTPSSILSDFFQSRFPELSVKTVGHPALETALHWQLSEAFTRWSQQTLNPNQKTILFVGGYGVDYTEAVECFCQALEQYPCQTILSIHPQMDGLIERQLIQRHRLAAHTYFLPKTIDTLDALAYADLVISHHSTLSVQALLKQKPSILVGPSHPHGLELLTHTNLAERCGTPLALREQLQRYLNNSAYLPPSAETCFKHLAIPKDSVVQILSLLQEIGVLLGT